MVFEGQADSIIGSRDSIAFISEYCFAGIAISLGVGRFCFTKVGQQSRGIRSEVAALCCSSCPIALPVNSIAKDLRRYTNGHGKRAGQKRVVYEYHIFLDCGITLLHELLFNEFTS